MDSGKSYCSERYAIGHDLCFLEGDDYVTLAMLERVRKFKPIPMDYVRVLAAAIVTHARLCDFPGQALYLDEDRYWLATHLHLHGFTTRFHWVSCGWFRNVRRLLTRQHGFRWVLYWLINKPFFQKPIASVHHVRN